MAITDLGMGVKLEIKQTETMGQIAIMDNYIEDGIWNNKRQVFF